MSPEELRTSNDRFFEEVINNRNFSIVEEFLAPDYKVIGSEPLLQGPDGFRQLAQNILSSFPDIRFKVEDFMVAGDKTIVRWSSHGTHLGTWGTIPATGKTINGKGITISRLNSEDKVVDEWIVSDDLRILFQIGALPLAVPATA
ncbi:MAG: hypothetical protein JWP00_2477 [Chloroflexi bacterium]|jgi:predicted ester cyclase|nr:hypothetical protein [Chloroflexota bacterium]